MTKLLRRHGLALVLTTALVYVFVAATLPALRERSWTRAQRIEAEEQVRRENAELERRALWVRGALEDPFVRERLLDVQRRSPDLPGPHYLPAADTEVGSEP